MSIYFPNYIEFINVPGKGPGLREHARHIVKINTTSTASIERYNDIWNRCHIYAAAVLHDSPDRFILACDLYLAEEYATFPHIEKCLHGMTMAFLQRQGEVPFALTSHVSKPRRYRLVPNLINFNLVYATTS